MSAIGEVNVIPATPITDDIGDVILAFFEERKPDTSWMLVILLALLLVLGIGIIYYAVKSRRERKEHRMRLDEIQHEAKVLIVCPYCGTKTEQGIINCQSCGAKL